MLCVRRRQSSKHREAAEVSVQVARFELSNDKATVFELAETEGHEWVQEIAARARPPKYDRAASLSGQPVR